MIVKILIKLNLFYLILQARPCQEFILRMNSSDHALSGRGLLLLISLHGEIGVVLFWNLGEHKVFGVCVCVCFIKYDGKTVWVHQDDYFANN